MSKDYGDELRVCRSCGLKFLLTYRDRQEPVTHDICPGCRTIGELTRARRGAVKWYSPKKGYGFVRGDDGVDAFVHASSVPPRLQRALRPGCRVQYFVKPGDRGPTVEDLDLSG